MPERYFLIGDKGMGKTAFAVFLSNNNYRGNECSTVTINETEYQSFIELKRANKLTLSGYDLIWRVILLLLLSEAVKKTDYDASFIGRHRLFDQLKDAIHDYYRGAFSPEIITALKMVESSEESVRVLLGQVEGGAKDKQELSTEEHRFQSNLRVIERTFLDALGRLKLIHNITLFVDGIDVRPHDIEYEDYIECIRGLANAAWHLNHKMFSGFKDSIGRFKVVTLLRPDIFASLGLHNQNAKIQDNSVYLDWLTSYPQHRDSEIFQVADHLLAVQQKETCHLGAAWDHYFPFANADADPIFVSFLRFSFFRPRDINKMMHILQENVSRSKNPLKDQFTLADFNNADFRRDYSNYLLGEVKDYLQFYYTEQDIGMFLKFFSYLDGGATFSLNDFRRSFDRFTKSNFGGGVKRPHFVESAESFLQFLYELGIICYKDYTSLGKTFYHLCFRERTYANMHPKVSFEADEYMIHHGLQKALDVGARKTRSF